METRSVEAGRGAAWLTEGWNYFAADWLTWIGVMIILIVVNAICAKVILLGLAFGLVFPVIVAGLMLGCRAHDEGGNLTLNHLVAGFGENVGQLVLSGLLVLVGMIIVGFIAGVFGGIMFGGAALQSGEMNPLQLGAGFLVVLLIALGLSVPVLMAGWFAPALIVFGKLGAVDALKQSFSACLNNMVPFLVYGLVGLALAILATIPVGLGWFVLLPMTFASMYIAYKDVFGLPAAGAG